MKHMTIRIFCLALCTSLVLSGCTPKGGDSQTAEGNSTETVTEETEGTEETSASETAVTDVTDKNEAKTTAVSGTDVSGDAKVSDTVSETAKVSETTKKSETAKAPDITEVKESPAPAPSEGNKPDTYSDPSEYGYSDDELCSMAIRYYASSSNYRPDHAEVDGTDGNTVSIHLYDDTDGTHTSTSAWYYVDRMTGKGENVIGNPVDLTAPPELWNPNVPPRAKIEDGKWCGVVFIGYIDTDIETYIARNVAYREFTLQEDDYTWLADLPKQNRVETSNGNELYLLIPRDDEANVRISKVDDEGNASERIYNSYKGAPILLRCNVSEIRPDVIIEITDNSGEHKGFAPSISGRDGLLCESDCYTRLMEYPVIGGPMMADNN